jgi:hypothetical protein
LSIPSLSRALGTGRAALPSRVGREDSSDHPIAEPDDPAVGNFLVWQTQFGESGGDHPIAEPHDATIGNFLIGQAQLRELWGGARRFFAGQFRPNLLIDRSHIFSPRKYRRQRALGLRGDWRGTGLRTLYHH